MEHSLLAINKGGQPFPLAQCSPAAGIRKYFSRMLK